MDFFIDGFDGLVISTDTYSKNGFIDRFKAYATRLSSQELDDNEDVQEN